MKTFTNVLMVLMLGAFCFSCVIIKDGVKAEEAARIAAEEKKAAEERKAAEEKKAAEKESFTDSRDGEVYKKVKIGNQTWMAENLRYNAAGSWLNPNNPSSKYGRLYDWSAVMAGSSSSSAVPSGVQGICPSGWHVPSDEEWKILEKTLGMSQADVDNTRWRGTDQGTQMKSTSGWASNGNGSNNSGFNAFPAGRYTSGSFNNLGYGARFWSSTEHTSSSAWGRYLYDHDSKVYRGSNHKPYGFSCRCVEN